MITLGIEMSDDGFLAAVGNHEKSELLELGGGAEGLLWPAFALRQGRDCVFGQPAEDTALLQPRQICSTFWEDLSRHPSDIGGQKGSPASSELGFYFLQSVLTRIRATGKEFDKVILAVPGNFLEPMYGREEKIGLLLGMARDLGLPLAGIADLACASLYNTTASQVNPNFPIFHIDVHLHATHLSVLARRGDTIVRTRFLRIPQLGLLEIIERLMSISVNRFLRETAFDLSADRRIEQGFYQKLKNILTSRERVQEAVVHVQTEHRSRQMKITREVLRADSAPFVEMILQGLSRLVREAGVVAAQSTVVLTERAARVRGLEVTLRAQGYRSICKLDIGDAARGAVNYGALKAVARELEETPVETAVTLAVHDDPGESLVWEPMVVRPVRLGAGRSLVPTHFVVDGMAFGLPSIELFALGTGRDGSRPEVVMPKEVVTAGDFFCRMARRDGRLYLLSGGDDGADWILVEAGDKLCVGPEAQRTELLFVHALNGR